jgi:hypothetical protein
MPVGAESGVFLIINSKLSSAAFEQGHEKPRSEQPVCGPKSEPRRGSANIKHDGGRKKMMK